MTSRLRELLDKPQKNGRTLSEVLVEVAVKEAAKGKFNFFKEIIDRVDGKIPDTIVEGKKPADMTDDELADARRRAMGKKS